MKCNILFPFFIYHEKDGGGVGLLTLGWQEPFRHCFVNTEGADESSFKRGGSGLSNKCNDIIRPKYSAVPL